jgi:hypothetical protein
MKFFLRTERTSVRERDLPAHVVVYYVIALALYKRSSYREVLRCLPEGEQWLPDPSVKVKVAGKSGISQARTRLGAEAIKQLYDGAVRPIAEKRTKGAWYRRWRLVSLDGSTLDVADTAENEQASGRRSRLQRLSENSLCGAAGEWDPCVVGRAHGSLRH